MSDTGTKEATFASQSADEPIETPLFSCGTDSLHEELLQTSNHYKSVHRIIDTTRGPLLESSNRITGRIRIPIVVHVVHHPDHPEQKVTAEQVRSQIAALNRDFNHEAEDKDDVPQPWKHLATNPNITFFLTRRDPDGEPHEGIIWKETAIKQFETKDADGDRVKTTTDGSLAWDTSRFLNVWVCDLATNAGFAYRPAAKDVKKFDVFIDGVVISYECFSTFGPKLSQAFNLGRTLVHEVGHYLDLPHTFGSDQASISDTPRLKFKNTGKPLYPKVSTLDDIKTNGPHGDMFMNFMDYSDDDTTIMFTRNQVQVMRATLMVHRRSLFGTTFTQQFAPKMTKILMNERTSSMTTIKLLDWYQNGVSSLVSIQPHFDPNQNECRLNVYPDATTPLEEPPSGSEIHTSVPVPTAADRFIYAFVRWPYQEQEVAAEQQLNQKTLAARPSISAIRCKEDMVEVDIWTSQSNYETKFGPFTTILQVGSDFNDWDFLVADWNQTQNIRGDTEDLVAIRKSHTVNGKVELHVLSGTQRYTKWLAHKYTALDEIGGPAQFMFTDWNGDGYRDLVVIHKEEDAWLVDILAGANDYRDFLMRVRIDGAYLSTHQEYEFAMIDVTKDSRPDLVAFQKTGLVEMEGKVQMIVLLG